MSFLENLSPRQGPHGSAQRAFLRLPPLPRRYNTRKGKPSESLQVIPIPAACPRGLRVMCEGGLSPLQQGRVARAADTCSYLGSNPSAATSSLSQAPPDTSSIALDRPALSNPQPPRKLDGSALTRR